MNYTMILHSLWPADFSGLVLLKVLDDANWGEELGSEKQRVAVIRRTFDDVAKENGGRAIRKQALLGHDQVLARWEKAVTRESKRGGEPQQKQMDGGKSSSGQPVAGKAGQKGTGKGDGKTKPPPARHNGLPVCFGFNTVAGCARTAQGPNACVDGNTKLVYAHVCSWYTRPAAGQQGPGTYCYGLHPKYQGNH